MSSMEVDVTAKKPATDSSGDLKRKFREALDKKNEHEHASAEAAEHDGSEKSHGANGPTKGPAFRRKAI